MAGNLPEDPSLNKTAGDLANIHDPEDLDCYARRWYFSRQEVEELSPSRKDGIREDEESHLRKLYCAFIQELGMELKVPQLTIATALLMCQRFYMRQSHAKNCWQTIATACMFLGCKVEETPRWLSDVIVAAYKLMYKWDPSASRRIKQKEVYDKQKELVIRGERFLLATLAFNMNIEHPYKPLVWALKKLEISDKELTRVAWNFVNDWLRTSTLCLQYKPHYIAAGSIFLAARIRKVKLPKGWRTLFDISPKYMEEVVQQMMRVLEQNQQNAQQSMRSKGNAPKTTAKKALSSSPDSCTLNGPVASGSCVLKTTENAGLNDSVSVSSKCDKKQVSCKVQDSMKETSLHSSPVTGKALPGSIQAGTVSGSHNSGISVSMASVVGLHDSVLSKCNEKIPCSNVPDTLKETKVQCQASDCGSADSVVEDCEDQLVKEKPDLNLSCKIVSVEGSSSKINLDRIRELRKRKRDMTTNRKLLEGDGKVMMDSEAWIEKEIENGILLESSNKDKQRRL